MALALIGSFIFECFVPCFVKYFFFRLLFYLAHGSFGDVRTSVLKLFDEVFVRHLGKTSTLVCVEVDVIGVHTKTRKSRYAGSRRNTSSETLLRHELFGFTKFDVNFDFVVLESDKREYKPLNLK